jgi:hypothetical protein
MCRARFSPNMSMQANTSVSRLVPPRLGQTAGALLRERLLSPAGTDGLRGRGW